MAAASPNPRLFTLCWPIVWLAGVLVPKGLRAPWRSKQRRQVWHWAAFLAESPIPNGERDLARYAWATWAEAAWLRWERERTLRTFTHVRRSPRLPLAIGAAAVVAVILFSGLLPITRASLLPLPYGNAGRLGVASYVGSYWSSFRSTVPSTWEHVWSSQSSTLDAVAEYTFESSLPGGPPMLVGEVSPNFFDTLGVGAQWGETLHERDAPCPNCLVVNYDFWRKALHADRSVIGQEVALGANRWRILGVMPKRFWFVARDAAAWKPMPPAPPDPVRPLVFSKAMGLALPTPYQLPRLVAPVVLIKHGITQAQAESDLNRVILRFIYSPSGHVVITPIERQLRELLIPYAIAILAALGLTLITAYVRFRDFIRGANRRVLARWWGYLALKTFLLLFAAALISLELLRFIGRGGGVPRDPSAWPFSIWLCLAFCVAITLWALRDQRYRCRVCLSRLGHDVMVGDQSRMLFDSGATEFVCPHGHGLLHISNHECSWIDAEHWTRLDPSWVELFREEG